jgi:Wiskott-Aldrich syndrome protein
VAVQQIWSRAPQEMQVVPLQIVPDTQEELAQHDWPRAPHGPQVPLAGQPVPEVQGVPVVQQGSPSAPQWHMPPTQIPFGQVPVAGAMPQTPSRQVAWLQTGAVQAVHAAPRAPHAAIDVCTGGTHRVPSQHPSQQAPFRHVPAGQVAAEQGGGVSPPPPSEGPSAPPASRGASPAASAAVPPLPPASMAGRSDGPPSVPPPVPGAPPPVPAARPPVPGAPPPVPDAPPLPPASAGGGRPPVPGPPSAPRPSDPASPQTSASPLAWQ